MSKYIKTIPLSQVAKIAIVAGNNRSLAQVKGTADYIINGGFYDGPKAVGHLKIRGQVMAKSAWNCWGYRWDTGGDIRMDVVPDSGGSNYISGVELLTRDLGPGDKLSYSRDVGGKRGRTSLAMIGDKLVLYCSGDGTRDAHTPEGLRDELYRLGADTAIMLDGGGSSQCDFGGGDQINSTRRVHNYIAVWLKHDKEEDKPMGKTVCLDPGHGVETAGKRSPDGTYFEHEFNLDMARRVKALLERHGVAVTMTRTDEHDVSLAKRVQIANGIKGLDLFVSLHSNAQKGTGWLPARGYGIYTSVAGATAGRNIAAGKILARAKAAGVKLWGDGLHHDVSLYVLKNTVAPAVIIEHAFHNNREDVALLKAPAYRQKLAEVDARGILDYLGIAWEDVPTDKPQEPDKPTVGCVCPHCGGQLKVEKG